MGNTLQNVKDVLLPPQRNSRIVMVGLDNSGKTTILYKLHQDDIVTPSTPTIGFSIEGMINNGSVVSMEVKSIKMEISTWDVGREQDKTRDPIRKRCLQESEGLVYVIDSADRSRFNEAVKELKLILDETPTDVPLMVLSNKEDLPNVAPPSEITEIFELSGLQNRPWNIQTTCAVSGDGIYESLNELASMVKTFQKTKH